MAWRFRRGLAAPEGDEPGGTQEVRGPMGRISGACACRPIWPPVEGARSAYARYGRPRDPGKPISPRLVLAGADHGERPVAEPMGRPAGGVERRGQDVTQQLVAQVDPPAPSSHAAIPISLALRPRPAGRDRPRPAADAPYKFIVNTNRPMPCPSLDLHAGRDPRTDRCRSACKLNGSSPDRRIQTP